MAANDTAEAARAFQEELDRLLGDSNLEDPAAVGRRSALFAAARGLWERHLEGLLSPDQVRELLGVQTRNAVHDLVRRRRLLRLEDRAGHPLYPQVQFDHNGRPFEVLDRILAEFDDAHVSPWTVASFLASSQPLLDGETPRNWLLAGRDAGRVVEAARRAAGRLAR